MRLVVTRKRRAAPRASHPALGVDAARPRPSSTLFTRKDGERKLSLYVLIVDDVEENLDLLEYRLTNHGYRTVRAKNGQEALEQLGRHRVDLIVSDAMMPVMDGFQFCKEVKSLPEYKKIPFVVYTSNYLDKEDESFARHLGVDRYIMKSELDELLSIVDEMARGNGGSQSMTPDDTDGGIDDLAFLTKHHQLVVKKLDEKMNELKVYTEVLAKKNRDLQTSERRYRELFEYSSIAIFTVDPHSGKILDVNRHGLALLEYGKQELLAMAVFPFGEDGRAPGGNDENGVMFSSGERRVKTRSGKILDVDLRASQISTEHAEWIILHMRDITEEKKLKAQLMLAEKMTIMGRLAGGIAHEIRNPLAAVLLNIQHLQQKFSPDSSERQFLDAAGEGAGRINQVVQNTLNLARSEPPMLRSEGINEILRTALWFMKVPAQQKNVHIDLHLSDDLPHINVDAKQIQQVLINLMQNALDASPAGSTVTVTSGALQQLVGKNQFITNRVVLVIKDSGSGLTEEQRRNLFEPLRTTKAGGTGLGLALSKYIMDQHNAELSLEPALGGGTVASLVFPVGKAEKGPAHVKR